MSRCHRQQNGSAKAMQRAEHRTFIVESCTEHGPHIFWEPSRQTKLEKLHRSETIALTPMHLGCGFGRSFRFGLGLHLGDLGTWKTSSVFHEKNMFFCSDPPPKKKTVLGIDPWKILIILERKRKSFFSSCLFTTARVSVKRQAAGPGRLSAGKDRRQRRLLTSRSRQRAGRRR